LIIDEEDVHDLYELVPAVEVGLGGYLPENPLPLDGLELHALQQFGLGVLADDLDVVEGELLRVVTVLLQLLRLQAVVHAFAI
jgi:hypothetical protein